MSRFALEKIRTIGDFAGDNALRDFEAFQRNVYDTISGLELPKLDGSQLQQVVHGSSSGAMFGLDMRSPFPRKDAKPSDFDLIVNRPTLDHLTGRFEGRITAQTLHNGQTLLANITGLPLPVDVLWRDRADTDTLLLILAGYASDSPSMPPYTPYSR